MLALSKDMAGINNQRAALEGRIRGLRAFNRFYTEILGLLGEGLLQTSYSLPESRVLFELGSAGPASPSDLAERLRLDLGYVSRLVGRLTKRRLVTGKASAMDRRRRVISLTKEGRKAFRLLDARSSSQTRQLLDPLTEDGQERLLASASTIENLLDEPHPRTVVLREPVSGDFGWVVQRHGALYRDEFGWDETFEALVARIVADYIEDRDPQRERAWIAEVNDQRAGCVFCTKKTQKVAQLRILLVEPSARGLGIGRRLVDECIRFARQAGYKQIMLWTNDVLVSARRIYEAADFRLVEEERHRSFGRDLVGQNWILDL